MKLVITMSRRFGTGASIIAKELSERLDIPVYDKAYIEQKVHDHMYESEAEAIRKLAENPCIILGRCASDILKDRMNVLNIFVCADKEDRIHRIMEKDDLSYDDAKEKVEKTDEERASYYYEHTGKTWGDVNDYHMILDTSELGVENCPDILMHYFEKCEYISKWHEAAAETNPPEDMRFRYACLSSNKRTAGKDGSFPAVLYIFPFLLCSASAS